MAKQTVVAEKASRRAAATGPGRPMTSIIELAMAKLAGFADGPVFLNV
jgi:hypothetical protein